MNRYPRTIPGPYGTRDIYHFTEKNDQILSQKDWGSTSLAGSIRHWFRRRSKYDICPAPLHQPPNYPPKLGCYTLRNTILLLLMLVMQLSSVICIRGHLRHSNRCQKRGIGQIDKKIRKKIQNPQTLQTGSMHF